MQKCKQFQNQPQSTLTVEVWSGATEHARGNRAISYHVSLAVARHSCGAALGIRTISDYVSLAVARTSRQHAFVALQCFSSTTWKHSVTNVSLSCFTICVAANALLEKGIRTNICLFVCLLLWCLKLSIILYRRIRFRISAKTPAALKKIFRSFSRPLQARRDAILVTPGPLCSKSFAVYQPPVVLMSKL